MAVIRCETIRSRSGYPAPVGAVEAMNQGARTTAAELYQLYLEDVFRYVLHRVRRPEEAEDITGEVFVAAFAGLDRFRGHCPPYHWLLSIARRKIIDARRRAGRRETLASELADTEPDAGHPTSRARGGWTLWGALAVEEGPEAGMLRAEARQVLGELVAGLNADQREALVLQYVEGLSVAEIAQVMDRSPGSVKGLLERAKGAIFRRGRGYFLEHDEEQGQ